MLPDEVGALGNGRQRRGKSWHSGRRRSGRGALHAGVAQRRCCDGGVHRNGRADDNHRVRRRCDGTGTIARCDAEGVAAGHCRCTSNRARFGIEYEPSWPRSVRRIGRLGVAVRVDTVGVRGVVRRRDADGGVNPARGLAHNDGLHR